MKVFFTILTVLLISQCYATEYLTKDDFESKTSGKKALVAFKAPWCGHCKRLKPDWDKLADAVDIVVGEVDCTVEKDLCAKHGVQGFPTIKYSNGFGWKKYEKARDLSSLETFVEKELGDSCLDDPNLCSEEELEKLNKYKSMNTDEIHIRLEEIETKKEDAEAVFKVKVEKLQKKYKELQEKKNKNVADLDEEESYLRYTLNSNKEEL